jgi:hypothetical protein
MTSGQNGKANLDSNIDQADIIAQLEFIDISTLRT